MSWRGMKAETSQLHGGFGEIVLFPENVDDVWHLSHIVGPGDLVFASTFRAPESSADKIRPEKLEKRLVRLGIQVEKVEFHKYSARLRISGLIEQGVDAGSHHTLNIEPGFEISVIKDWKSTDLERIERAVTASIHGAVHILTIEEGDAALFRLRQYGPEPVFEVSMGSGKREGIGSRSAFFERLYQDVKDIDGPLVVAGPGFIKDDFVRYLRTVDPDRAEKTVVAETRRVGRGAVQDVIGQGVVDRLSEDLQLGHEVRLMEQLLGRIACDQPAAYGREEVSKALAYGACEVLMVSDLLLRDPGIVHLLDRAEETRTKVVIFSSSFDPGAQLDALGGIAALLRYRME